MEKRLLGATLALVLGCLGVVAIGADFPLTVASISVEGTVNVRDKDVLDAVPFEVGEQIDEADLRSASQSIFDLGWFSEVSPRVGEDGSITFRVTENPKIEEIIIEGNVHRKVYRLLGIRLFDAPIMPTAKIKQLLRDHDIRKGQILSVEALQAAIDDVLQAYKDRGYVLVMVGNVSVGPTLKIQFIEGVVAGNQVAGLETVPASVAEGMINIPLEEPLQQSDIQNVASTLRESVYFTGVDVAPLEGPTSDSVILKWTLTERMILETPAPVQQVVLEGVTQLPLDVAQASIASLPDGPVDNYQLLTSLQRLYELYYNSGYIMIRFRVASLDQGILTLQVEEGRISQINILGNTQTQERVIHNNLELHVGRILTRNDLAVSYQQLTSLGYFGQVNIEPVWGDDGIEITVSVTERDDLGGMNGAIALEPNTGGVVGELSINQRNLFGTGQDVSLSYKRGLSPEGEPETSTWNLGYTTMAFIPEFDEVSVDLYRKVQEVRDGEEQASYLTLGGQVSFSYPIADYTDLAIAYKHEEERQIDVTQSWSPIDSVTLSVAENSTDDPFFPTRGSKRMISVEKAGGFSVGEEYAKIDLTWVRFTPQYGDWFASMDRTFAIRLKAGWGTGELRPTQAYELGGPTTVRGFTGASVQRMFVSNLEYRIELIDGLVLTTFMDYGVDLDSIRLDDTLASTGLELGITAAGIFVRIDVAWVLGPEASWMPRFEFGFGPMF